MGKLLIALLMQAGFYASGLSVRDDTSSGCKSFNFTLPDKTYLPSEVIAMSGSCQGDSVSMCPSWNLTSSNVRIIVLRNDTVNVGPECIRNMEIQVIFQETAKESRVQLLVEFQYPMSEPIKEINIQRSGSGEFCQQSRDCYYPEQFCSSLGTCACTGQRVFIRNMEKCVPALYKLGEQCQNNEQCMISNSVCDYRGCKCRPIYTPNLNYSMCHPDGAELYSQCSSDENCLIKTPNSACLNNYCSCINGYRDNYKNDARLCVSKGSGILRPGATWMFLLYLVIFQLKFKV